MNDPGGGRTARTFTSSSALLRCTSKSVELLVSRDSSLATLAKSRISSGVNALFRPKEGKRVTSEAVYNPFTLAVYDTAVWSFNSPHLWRIKEHECQDLYKHCLREKHCEVAVGTGLFLKKRLGSSQDGNDANNLKDLTLMDLNQNTLDIGEKRISAAAEKYGRDLKILEVVVDITKPDSIPEELRGSFQSVAANFLVHCLHADSILDKRAAFESCASLLASEINGGGCFFGSTILGHDLLEDEDIAGPAAVNTIHKYNDWGIFDNKGDTFEDVEIVLHDLFHDVEVWKSGYCAVWKANNPK